MVLEVFSCGFCLEFDPSFVSFSGFVRSSLLFVYMIEELDLLVEFYLWLFSVVWSLWSLWVN